MSACYCGRGCSGRQSITDPRVRSERDVVAKFLDIFGRPMPVYAEGAYDDGPIYYIESIDDPRIDAPVPKAAPRQRRADPYEGDPVRKARFNEAVAYIRDYTGTWDFILSLRTPPPAGKWGTKWFRLSDRQVEVILRAKQRDAERQRERVRNQTGRDLTVLPYGRTYAAVDNAEGGITFLIIDRPKPDTKWSGWVFVKQQQGPNEVKLGMQRPGETYVGQWPSLIDAVLADPMAAVVRYGQELGVCGVCGSPLTNAVSREEGIGPICRAKLVAAAAAA